MAFLFACQVGADTVVGTDLAGEEAGGGEGARERHPAGGGVERGQQQQEVFTFDTGPTPCTAHLSILLSNSHQSRPIDKDRNARF